MYFLFELNAMFLFALNYLLALEIESLFGVSLVSLLQNWLWICGSYEFIGRAYFTVLHNIIINSMCLIIIDNELNGI